MKKNKQPTLSLAMITKNSGSTLKTALTSIAPFVDEIVIVDNGSTDNTIQIAKKFGAKVYEVNPKDNPEYFCEYGGKWWPNFTRLRRLSFEKCTKDWIFWIDSDDVVEGSVTPREVIAGAEEQGLNNIALVYNYHISKEGRIRKQHTKDRFVKRGEYQWEYDDEWAVHENLYPVKGVELKSNVCLDIVIKHNKNQDENAGSSDRNYNILMWMLQKDKFKKDPRVIILLGRELVGLREYAAALKMFNKYLDMEYAPHDALEACLRSAEINEAAGVFDSALSYSLRAISVRPDHPMGYIYAARYFNYQGRYREALDFLELAKQKEVTVLDSFVQEPYAQFYLTVESMVNAYKGLREWDKAIMVISENFNNLEEEDRGHFKDISKDLRGEILSDKISDAFRVLVDLKLGELEREQTVPTIHHFSGITSVFADGIKLSRDYVYLRRMVKDYRVHDKDEITFVHISNFESWDPETLYNNGGGGSETALIEMSTELAKLGMKVTVYADPPEEREFNGVQWKKFSSINLADEFNIFCSLRSAGIFKDYNIIAKHKWLWLQDIMSAADYTDALWDQLDKIIVLSDYHRSTALNVPESKFYYTTNGLNLRLIKEVEETIKGDRIKDRCLYISSADRGLEGLLDMIPAIRKAVPSFNGTWFYGWESTLAFNKERKSVQKFVAKINKKLEKTGFEYGGRVSKRELYKQLFTADYHTYPLIGPAETSCIAVMESQACGCIPITTGITALEQTQQYGIKVPIEKYKDTLIKTLKQGFEDDEEYRKEMMAWARETYNWETIAKRWYDDLINT